MRIEQPSVYVTDTGTPKGRGVFASRSFRKEDVVEICPVVVLRGSFRKLPLELQRLVYGWHLLAGEPGTHAVAFGYGSLYNSANPANMRFEADRNETVLRFIAARSIVVGEELTVNYSSTGGGAVSRTNDWFKRLNVKFIASR
jgi:uncharacterized protein